MGNNTARGCGGKRAGRVYGEADSGEDGFLRAWAWALDSMRADGALFKATIPALGQVAINPRLSLYLGQVVSFEQGLLIERESGEALLNRLPPQVCALGKFALIDHVGAEHYREVWDFVGEVYRLGPSRVVRKDLAKLASQYAPFPIFFTHEAVPMFTGTPQRDSFITEVLGREAQELRADPCWEYPDWGLTVEDWDGGDHFGALALQHIGRERAGDELLQYPCSDNLIGASWITKLTYYVDNFEDAKPADLQGLNIGVAVLDSIEY